MNRVRFSQNIASISEIWGWYETSRRALARYQHSLVEAIGTNRPVPDEFMGLTDRELGDQFQSFDQELQFAACLAMMSAAEATIRRDYALRTYRRKRDDLSRAMRDLYKERATRVSLSDELLELWQEHHPRCKRAIGEFRGAIRFRDWLAHGRWWMPKLGRSFRPEDVFDIADGLFQRLPGIEGWTV